LTGSGKSYFVKAALRMHKGAALVIDPQGEGDWPALYLTGKESLVDIYRALRRGVHVAYVPDKEPDKALRLLATLCADFVTGAWGNLWLVVDEVQTYAPKHVASPLEWVAMRGRTHGVRGIWISQRPAQVSHTLLTQASTHVLFYLSAFEDGYLRDIGLDGEDLRRRLGTAKDHQYMIWDGSTLAGPYKA
jgi:DNA helicase HerA-like ATPase